MSSKPSIPYTLPVDDMPIDLRPLFAGERPAGVHGFLKADGAHLVFEDGAEVRFWGTNFNSGACFPSHAYSEKVARRLAKTGLNLVRFHQMDAEWSTPNLFQFTKGARLADTRRLDPESLDRLDYLIHCLKREGVYVYLDLLTYRRFKLGDGVAEADQLPQAARPYSNFDRRLIELQQEFSAALWTHVNPYTRLAYKDDPVIALCEIVNENDLWHGPELFQEPYRSRLEERFRAWARERGRAVPPGPVAFGPKPADPLIQAFYVEITQAYYREMIAHLRGLGVRIPLAGTNWAVHSDHLACQAVADFTDGHTYWWDFGGWNAKGRTFMNQAMVGQPSSILPPLAFNRLPDKPYFVSEWDNPWPNEWRAESALFLAAVGAFQGWGGFAIHTYRYDTDETTDQIGRPITSDAIGGVRYRGGVFDTFNDPAKYGLFYHAALITRRRDVAPARETLGIRLDGGLAGAGSAFRGAPEQHGVVSLLPRREPPAGVREVANQAVLLDEAAGEVRSDTGELYRSWSRRFGWINTPRTRAAYGFLGAQGEIRLSGLTIAAETDFATIALSSLTDAPLEESDSFLLTAVGRADNTDARYNADHTEQLDRGRGPILVEAVRAVLTLHTAQRALRAWSVNPRGFYIGNPPAEYRDGVYRLTIGGEFASMFYLIQSE